MESHHDRLANWYASMLPSWSDFEELHAGIFVYRDVEVTELVQDGIISIKKDSNVDDFIEFTDTIDTGKSEQKDEMDLSEI
jgi:hypothetical protein